MINDTETPETDLRINDEIVSQDSVEAAAEQDVRLTTAELQATLERLEALTAENNALKADNEALQADKIKLEDNWKRSEAEMANLRRRTEREIAENAKYAVSSFARDVIGVADNIRRAIEAVPKQAVASDPALANLLEGVEVTEREVFKILERQNIIRFDPKGEKFDPHVHEAMMRVETSDMPPETVLQVIQAGYMIGERVLRAAAVVVAKAGSGVSSGGAQPTPTSGTSVDADQTIPVPDDALDNPYDTGELSQPQPETDEDAGATVVRMQRRDGAEGARPVRRAQIIRPVTSTTSVLSTKRPSSMTRPVINGGQPSREAQSDFPDDAVDSE